MAMVILPRMVLVKQTQTSRKQQPRSPVPQATGARSHSQLPARVRGGFWVRDLPSSHTPRPGPAAEDPCTSGQDARPRGGGVGRQSYSVSLFAFCLLWEEDTAQRDPKPGTGEETATEVQPRVEFLMAALCKPLPSQPWATAVK